MSVTSFDYSGKTTENFGFKAGLPPLAAKRQLALSFAVLVGFFIGCALILAS